MAKRMDPLRASLPSPNGRASERCRICGGAIVVEDLHRDPRYPRRLTCLTCGAEYGTTRPPFRNY